MPTAYRISVPQALVYSWGWGELTGADLMKHYRRLVADPAFSPTFGHLSDLRDVTSLPASAAALTELALADPFAPDVGRAIVAPTAETFGLSRMFAAYAETLGKQIATFRTMDGAEHWLDLAPGTADELR